MQDFLWTSQLFHGVTKEQLQLILPLCKQVTVEAGERIFKEGEPARFLYIVSRGRVALEMRLARPDGSVTRPTTVAGIGPGDAFGWSAFVEPHILTLSAQAVERGELIQIEGDKLRQVLNSHRDAGYLVMVNVAKLLADRLAQTREAFVYERDWDFKKA